MPPRLEPMMSMEVEEQPSARRLSLAECQEEALMEIARLYRPDLDLRAGFPQVWTDPFCMRDFKKDRLRRFLPRFALAFGWFYTCVYINNLAQAWLQANMTGFYEASWGYSVPNASAAEVWLKRNMPDVYRARYGSLKHPAPREDSAAMMNYYRNETVVLYDLVYLYLPKVNSSSYADTFAGFGTFFGAARYVIIPGPLSMRWTYMTRVLLVWGTMFLFRSFTIIATPLPNPYHECVPKITYPDNIWLEAYANLPGVFWDDELTCQDVLFSGHTAMGTVFTLFNWRYMKKAPWLRATVAGCSWIRVVVDIVACLWLCFGWYVIAASHFHYTVDVMVGAMLTFMVYNFYHRWIESIWVDRVYPFQNPLEHPMRWLEKHSLDLQYLRKCMGEQEEALQRGRSRWQAFLA